MFRRAMTRKTRTGSSDTDEGVRGEAQALLEADLGLVAEQPPRRAHVGPGVAHVAGALGQELLLDRLADHDRTDELRDDGRVLRVRVLRRAEDVEVPERHGLERVDAAEAHAVALGGELRDRVGRDRVGRLRLDARQRARVPVHRRARRDDHAAHALVARGEEDVERALDVHRARRQRVLHGARHGRQCALVEDDLDAARRGVHALVAPQLALDELDLALDVGKVLAAPGGEVVQHAHVVAALEQAADEVRADEAGPTGDEDLNLYGSATTWKLAIRDPERGSLRSVERRAGAAAPPVRPATTARAAGAG